MSNKAQIKTKVFYQSNYVCNLNCGKNIISPLDIFMFLEFSYRKVLIYNVTQNWLYNDVVSYSWWEENSSFELSIKEL